jgi:3D-(3,5/4)-trihydroxycyclohexane-1,2-dione acylhydrolase (decyclizing)
MEEADLLIAVGARGVCQWDSSGTAFKKVRRIININTDPEDLAQYNRTLALPGDAEAVLQRLADQLSAEKETAAHLSRCRSWLEDCAAKRREWEKFKTLRFEAPLLEDSKFRRPLMGQPAALKIAIDFADRIGAVKLFDAGDVQANGFQIVADEIPRRTFTDTGASYMGFAVSALLASAMVDSPDYTIAFTGDGSFLMNPQILTDAAEHRLKAMILLFDNRRMGAISSLQEAQYQKDYRTDDSVAVDYADLARSFSGVKGFTCEGTAESLIEILPAAYAWEGLSLVHIPVYYGEDPLGGLGAFGSWNVGNWCARVEPEKHRIGL